MSKSIEKRNNANAFFSYANSIAMSKEDSQVLDTYKQTIKTAFKSEILPLDIYPINRWAAEQTREKIYYLYDQIWDNSKAAILLNVAHFNSQWLWNFDNMLTENYTFYMTPEKSKTTLFMKTVALSYGHFNDGKMISFPFRQYGELSMYIFCQTTLQI